MASCSHMAAASKASASENVPPAVMSAATPAATPGATPGACSNLFTEGRVNASSSREGAVPSPHGVRDAAEEEAARVEWLSYYLQVGEFDQAEELVVTAAEREDLECLRRRAARP